MSARLEQNVTIVASKKGSKYDVQCSRERGFPSGAFPEADVQLGCGSIWLHETVDIFAFFSVK